MDDVQNISATLYGKAELTTAKTTMSVREMQHLLGLGKTDSYWLLHKNFFEVILINDKMRIVISSFEKWYANQVKYQMKSLLLVLFRGLCSLLRLTAQQKIN